MNAKTRAARPRDSRFVVETAIRLAKEAKGLVSWGAAGADDIGVWSESGMPAGRPRRPKRRRAAALTP
jgi:hypothetical protein